MSIQDISDELNTHAGTRMSIQDISDELSFGSRSFFFSSFQKETGMSPTAYRGEHCKG